MFISKKFQKLTVATLLYSFLSSVVADNAIVISAGYQNSENNVAGRLQAAGHTVTIVTSEPTDLTGYQQVWDLRYATALGSSVTTLYDTFLQNRGFIYFVTENPGCCQTRNDSIAQFITSVGGGSTTIGGSAGYADNVASNVNTTYMTAGITVNFAAVSAITNSQGTALISDSSNKVAGMMWVGNSGNLGAGYNGTIVTVADVNWLDSQRFNPSGTTAQQQNVTALDDIIRGVVAGTVGGTISNQGNGSASSQGGGGSQANDITSSNTKPYTQLGQSGGLNPVFAGGNLNITDNYTDTTTDFTVNDVPNNTITVAASKTASFSGVFSGAGALAKEGVGTLIISGVSNFSGPLIVNAGKLLVGSSPSESTATILGSATVNSGATLGGYGTVGASGTTLTNSGTVSPANSIGTLSVGGSYVQNIGGDLAIEITPTTNDLLAVTETASLAGQLTVTASSGTYAPTRYTLLTSSGRAGSFNAFTTNLSTYTTLGYFLSYDDNNAYLTLGPDYINTTTALTRNFEQMKSLFASQASLQISGLNYDCATFGQNNICLSTGGRTSHVFNKSDAYDGSHPMTTSALLIGAYRPDPTVRVGAWIDQNLNTQNSNIKMSNAKPMLGAFGVYSPAGDNTQWQVKAAASYVEKDLDITRQQLLNTEAGNGKTSFKGLAAQLEVGYGFAGILSNAVLSPVAGVRYFSGRTNDYTEEETTSVQVPITYNKVREIAGMAFAGLKLEGNIVPEFRYNLSAGVETDIKRNNPTYSGTSSMYGLNSFNLQGNSSPRDTRGYASVGASYLIDKTQSINFGIYYRQDQFKKVESVSSVLTYTVGL